MTKIQNITFKTSNYNKLNSQWTENRSKKHQYKRTKKGQIPKN